MPAYPESLLEHLENYRRDVLNIEEPGVFHYKGGEIPKKHILPVSQRDLNFLSLIRPSAETLKDASGNPIKWHRYSHHLNSSQVLAVNLFQPLLELGGVGAEVLAAVTGTRLPCMEPSGFEFVPDKGENTNIDFCVTGADGGRVLMELKLTEAEFGKAKDDESHQKKFRETYLPLSKGKIHLPEGSESKARSKFLEHYQIFRNVIHADMKTKVWFVLPRVHLRLWDQAQEALKFVSPEIRPQIEIKALGDIYQEIAERLKSHPRATAHYAEFKQKYRPALD